MVVEVEKMNFNLGYIVVWQHFETAFRDPLFILYVSGVLVDIVLGNIKAWTNGTVNSNVGVKGTLKHLGVFTFVILLLPPLTYYLGNNGVSMAVLGYLVYQYIVSIIENLGGLGYNVPRVFKDKLTQLGENHEEEHKE